jgi:hypothetical protein
MSFMSVQMARRGGHNGPIDDGLDKAVTIRPSSTANFYVDSLDKLPDSNATSGNFVISKRQALFNGFFNRIAVTEVLMDWGLPNVASWWGNNTISVTNGGTSTVIGPVTIVDGFYTAVQVLQAVTTAINDAATTAGNALRLTVVFNANGLVTLNSTGTGTDPFFFNWTDGVSPPYSLARQLFTSAQLAGAAVQDTTIVVASPRILGTTYVDIVSPQLTYNQDLKDATTSDDTRDVLYRWYLADDNVTQEREQMPRVYPAASGASAVTILTATNLPAIQGYTPFVIRRALPVPKQIRWDNTAPIGQVAFQVYDDRGRLIDTKNFPFDASSGYGGANFQFQMSMLLSEN